MSLRIYNTLSRALEEFSPLEPGHVRMYVCGMTSYDLCHIGHARMRMAFDVVQRWLKARVAAVHADIGALGLEPPTLEPRATRYVPGMLALIGQLQAKGLAYRASNGDVNYAVRKFQGYGKLSGKSPDELRAGA